MEGFQPEVLITLLYLTLIYELITAFRKKADQTMERMRKFSGIGHRRLNNSTKESPKMFQTPGSDNPQRQKSYRHFMQMRILGRD